MRTFQLDNLLPADYLTEALRADVDAGLRRVPKSLPPKWLYDARGSELFDEITRLPEYYPTRAEREILQARAGDIAERTGAAVVIELGAGSADKTRLLLTALRQAGTLRRFVAVDVSGSALSDAAAALRADYPDLALQGVVADFESQLHLLPHGPGGLDGSAGLDGPGGLDGSAGLDGPGERPRLTAFLGGTIGNLEPAERGRFLREVRSSLDPGDWFLLGTDLVKSVDVLIPAYDDAAGVTAAFNRNVLNVINRELKADFEPEQFAHVAAWDSTAEWIEMRLRSLREQDVRVEQLDLTVHFAAGEEMRTEISAKFRPERVKTELSAAGFGLREWWTDSGGRFALSLAQAV